MILENTTLNVICFIPRSGSNYLGDMLCRVGGMGGPLELYFPYDFKERQNHWHNKVDPFEFIDKYLIQTEGQWFLNVLSRGSVQCTIDAYEKMLEEAGGMLPLVDINYIYLRRRDKIKQAISWYRAHRSQRWTSLEAKKPDPPYDYAGIAECLGWVHEHEARWEAHLKDTPRLDLFYEDISYDTIKVIEDYTGLTRNREREVATTYEKLRDDLTEEWVERFTAKYRNFESGLESA